MPEEEKDPLPVRIKYYTTLTLGLVACLSCFIFMFLIPFVLDPSISTLIANFDPEPVICRTILTVERFGAKNCSWSSCKLGCTTDQYQCERIYVNYLLKPYAEYDGSHYEADDDIWDVKAVPVFINIKACGYTPNVNCTIFSENHAYDGASFPCFYSRTDPTLVITSYSWSAAVHSLIMAIIIPNLLTGVSLGVLSYWWYPGCQKRSCQYQVPPDQEAVISNEEGEISGDEGDSDEESARKSEGKQSSTEISIKSEKRICMESNKSSISDCSHTNL